MLLNKEDLPPGLLVRRGKEHLLAVRTQTVRNTGPDTQLAAIGPATADAGTPAGGRGAQPEGRQSDLKTEAGASETIAQSGLLHGLASSTLQSGQAVSLCPAGPAGPSAVTCSVHSALSQAGRLRATGPIPTTSASTLSSNSVSGASQRNTIPDFLYKEAFAKASRVRSPCLNVKEGNAGLMAAQQGPSLPSETRASLSHAGKNALKGAIFGVLLEAVPTILESLSEDAGGRLGSRLATALKKAFLSRKALMGLASGAAVSAIVGELLVIWPCLATGFTGLGFVALAWAAWRIVKAIWHLWQNSMGQQGLDEQLEDEDFDDWDGIFRCPIRPVIMQDPVTTPAGHTYERTNIEDWIARTGRDPITRHALSVQQLVPNRSLLRLINGQPDFQPDVDPAEFFSGYFSDSRPIQRMRDPILGTNGESYDEADRRDAGFPHHLVGRHSKNFSMIHAMEHYQQVVEGLQRGQGAQA